MLPQANMQGTVQRRVMHLDTRSAIACKHLRVRMAEGVVAVDQMAARLLWEVINDAQNANWAQTNDAQNPGWATIDNAQPASWSVIKTQS